MKRLQTQTKDERKNATVETLLDGDRNDQIPVSVRLWLEQFIERGEDALEHSGTARNPSTLEQARLIHQVLNSKYRETGAGENERAFPDEARDYIEEYLYRLSTDAQINVWNEPEAAVAALPLLLDCAVSSDDASPDLIALQSAIERLTTRRERHEFLTGERYSATTEEAQDIEAAYKLSRVLADPATSSEVVNKLDELMIEFSTATSVLVSHPALVRRAFLIMCDTKIRGRAKEIKAARDRITAYLAGLNAAKVEDAA